MMVKTDIIINDEDYEFTIIASKIEKFKKYILSQTINWGLICEPCIYIPYTRFAKSSLGLDGLMTKNVS
jgi:hypothetical protein